MSAPPRPFLRRFTLALLGMLLLMVVVFAGLGWVVWAHRDWIEEAIGQEESFRLSGWYMARIMDVMPGDRDGDGACDGAELWWATDPQNPSSLPLFHPYCISGSPIVGYCGERRATRWGHDLADGLQPWPRGFTVVVTADAPILLPKDGVGPPTRGPLVVTADERGQVEFDLLAETILWNAYVEFDNSVGSLGGRGYCYFPGWRAPIAISTNGGPPSEPLNWVEDLKERIVFGDAPPTLKFKAVQYDASWQAPAGWTGAYVIEAARADGHGRWLPVCANRSMVYEAHPEVWDFFPGYRGPLKFRVVPVSPTPPGAENAAQPSTRF